MKFPMAIQITMRAERASILRAKLAWLQFIKTNPGQPRLWLDEAERRQKALFKAGSWLGKSLERFLSEQIPSTVSWFVRSVLYARLIAAELRGSPWPIDLCDRTNGQLRRWEENGVLIGAYSVGLNGVDDGGTADDINLRLRADQVETPP
jgi:hypothetical protein